MHQRTTCDSTKIVYKELLATGSVLKSTQFARIPTTTIQQKNGLVLWFPRKFEAYTSTYL